MNTTQRIELFLWTWLVFFFLKKIVTQRIETFSMTLELIFFFKKRLKVLIFSKITHRIATFFEFMTQRIESSFTWLKELNFLNTTHRIEPFFFEYDQRIGPLISWIWRKELNRLIFEYDSKNWNYFWMTQRIALLYMTQRTEPFFFQIWLQEMNFFFKIWLTELNPPFSFDSQNRTLLFKMISGIEPFSKKWLEELNIFQ